MNSFWIIPLVALLIGSSIGGFTIYHKYTVTIPAAEIELLELREMSCDEITARNSLGSYQLPGNGVFASDKVDACIDAENAIKELERYQLNQLLADPNSRESLEKRLGELTKMNSTLWPLYEEHFNQTKILSGNLTDFENEINIISAKLSVMDEW